MKNAKTNGFIDEQRRRCQQLNEMYSEGAGLFNDTNRGQFKRNHSFVAETNIGLGESNVSKEIRRCPPSFDGLLCWSVTDAPGKVVLPCPPASIIGYTNLESENLRALAVASKLCQANGEWYRNSEGKLWSNYSLCALNTSSLYLIDGATGLKYPQDPAELLLLSKWLPIIRIISQIGYATSFTTLIIAMIIFSLLRKLRNSRNRLHMHLFASFIMRAFMALLKNWSFIDGIGLAWDVVLVEGRGVVKQRNTWACKVITSLWQYFIVANYSWILMEGLYLHNLVFLALCSDTNTIALYILSGWGLPSLIVIPWIIIRATLEDTLCWTTHENPSLFLIIRIPIIISVLFNFVLFLNIVRVLLVKLKTSVHLQRKKMQYRRWAKSTLVLVPLFGTHYTFFLGLSYHKDYHIEIAWLFCDQLFASFQGAFVALLYCLLNGEVKAELRREWKARQSKRNVDLFIVGHRELLKLSRLKTNRSEGDIINTAGIATRVSSMP